MSQPLSESILNATARVPSHVVYRAFVKETVILNLETGKYHGVNPTGARMLDVLGRSETIGDAAKQLAGEYGVPVEDVERDLAAFCGELAERGLIEVRGGGADAD